ncbi:tetratricopeptide repeat protein [Aurantimonas sp. VKM B-3413]|uniref:tetratricopeptide repeat protein n=1 Tax=Aurantimonas sp. VKM B-3413 TaxID=2779401 RepID=UPI001E410DBB|nr:tetratricopeptide repeat protein [Aurantimonas sp. VKM B-3413]MCB8839544.1 sel1 repeat family protein [Aurantimonas sp. VKM B-3413]
MRLRALQGTVSIAAIALVLLGAPALAQSGGDGAARTGKAETEVSSGSNQAPLLLPYSQGRSAEGNGPEGSADSKPASKSDLAYGAFQRGFYLTALQIATPLANLGDPAAQTLLGEIYSRGLGVAQDLKEAARWYEAAAGSGNPEAQFRFAMILLDGKVVAPDEAKARDLMKAAADKGLPLAEYNYGQMLIEASPAGGFAEAKTYFEKAANAGVADAQYAMSQLYAYGRGVQADDEKARAWLRAAAINGQDTAQIEYGIWLINGRGGPQKMKDGFRFLKRAAELGNPIAINRVAHLYKDGIGTEPDRLEAAKWAVIAKRVKNSDSQLDDFFRGLDQKTQKAALEAANRYRSG